MRNPMAPIALIAGRGDLPFEVVRTCVARGRPIVVVAIEGQHDDALLNLGVPTVVLGFGAVGALFDFLRAHRVQDIVMVGQMARPALSSLRMDAEGARLLARLGFRAFLGDNALMTFVVQTLEKEGFHVVGVESVLAQDILASSGILGVHPVPPMAWDDIRRGLGILKSLSDQDVGQAVIIQQGLVLGIEAIEGTQQLLQRCIPLKRSGFGGVLVKYTKTGQEVRVDLPTIGPETVKDAVRCGLAGIAIESGRTLLVHAEKVVAEADAAGLFVVGLASAMEH